MADFKQPKQQCFDGFHSKKLSPYSVRLSVRTLGFQPSKRGSTPLPSTRFNCIGLPMPVGNIAS